MLGQMLPEINAGMVGLTFLEGIMAFLSPCILPLLPIYLLYLLGGTSKTPLAKLVRNMSGFILGFTIVFVALGATASALGNLVTVHRVWLQRIAGLVMIIFGLNYIGVIKLAFLNRTRAVNHQPEKQMTFSSSLIFGAAFAASWTPCLTAFLGSALLLAANSDTLYQGMGLLVVFSLGLAIPFMLTAILWERFQHTFNWVKRNQRQIQVGSGIILVLVGIYLFFWF